MLKLPDVDRLRMLTPRQGRLRVVLDTDTFNEIDDQFALVQLLLSPERVDLEAVYAAPFHNGRSNGPGDGMERSYEEILRVFERMGLPHGGRVHRGVRDYVGPQRQPRQAAAVDDLISRARTASPDDPLHVVAIAAASNVASAILKAPDIVGRIVVVWLGGHAFEWPNQREFNLRQDVGAVQVMFDSGVPLVLVPCMGVTSHLASTAPEIDAFVRPHGDIGRFLADRFCDYVKDRIGRSKEIWDMAAVAYVLDSEWTPSVLAATPVLTDSVTYSFDRSRHLLRYVIYVDRDPILGDLFAKLRDRSLGSAAGP